MRRFFLMACLWDTLAYPLLGQRTLLHWGTMIDGRLDEPRQEVILVIVGSKITAIENGFLDPEPEDVVVDLTDKTVIPGFIDMHGHLEMTFNHTRYLDRFQLNEADLAFRAVANGKATLLAGFTTVRDLGGTGVNSAMR